MSKFTDTAPRVMARLMQECAWSDEDAAACFGNAGHESRGLTALQEIKPTVKGSRGGFGWYQWTGPRRRQFEAWCKANELDGTSEDANLGFLLEELKGAERSAVAAVKRAKGLEAKVKAFEMNYERAGVKHYPERLAWAQKALAAYRAVNGDDDVLADAAASDVLDVDHVKAIQQQLIAKGFRPGLVDGRVGGGTLGAVTHFRHDNGLPPGGIDSDFEDALWGAGQRPVDPARATGKPEGSRILSTSKIQTIIGGGLAAGGGVSQLGDVTDRATGLLDKADAAKGLFQRVGGYLEPLAALWAFLEGHPGLVLCAVGAVMAGGGLLVHHYRVSDFRTGKTQ